MKSYNEFLKVNEAFNTSGFEEEFQEYNSNKRIPDTFLVIEQDTNNKEQWEIEVNQFTKDQLASEISDEFERAGEVADQNELKQYVDQIEADAKLGNIVTIWSTGTLKKFTICMPGAGTGRNATKYTVPASIAVVFDNYHNLGVLGNAPVLAVAAYMDNEFKVRTITSSDIKEFVSNYVSYESEYGVEVGMMLKQLKADLATGNVVNVVSNNEQLSLVFFKIR